MQRDRAFLRLRLYFSYVTWCLPFFDGHGAHVFVKHIGAREIERAAGILILRHEANVQPTE